jgi:hypothetical protein
VIDYLERLERDLVDAVDARASRRRRLPRPRLVPTPGLAVAVAVLAVLVAAALLAGGRDRERTAVPTRPVAPVALRLAGDLTRVDATTWTARARGPGGVGILTFRAGAGLMTPHPHTLVPYTWTTAGGSLGGCVSPAIHRTSDGHIETDSLAPIAYADGTLRRFRGGTVEIAGRARTSASASRRIPLVAPAGSHFGSGTLLVARDPSRSC